MKITELFKSIEGEGIRTGYVCTFIRTFGCNIRCVYCDSMYSNEVCDDVIIMDLSIQEIVDECKRLKTPYVTVTGGEPLIQKDIDNLLAALLKSGFKVNVETNGAVDIKPHRDKIFAELGPVYCNELFFTIDYKSISSGENKSMVSMNFDYNLERRDVVKFVVGSQEDLDDMKRMVKHIRNYCDCPIFVSPIFGMIEPKQIVEYLKDNDMFDVRMQLQIHKFIYPFDMRGV